MTQTAELAACRMVRGGESRADTVLKSALVLHATHGRPGVSIFAANAADEELVEAAGDSLPHEMLRFGDVRCLLDAGFVVEQTGRPPHHTVWFRDVRVKTIASFLRCFGPPERRPRGAGV